MVDAVALSWIAAHHRRALCLPWPRRLLLPKAPKFKTPTNSSPITLSADGKLLWAVSPDSDNVSVINTKNNQVLKTIKIGEEPQQVARRPGKQLRLRRQHRRRHGDRDPDHQREAEQASRRRSPRTSARTASPRTGAEPWNIVISPDGQRVFVANSEPGHDHGDRRDRAREAQGKPKQPADVIGDVPLRGSACSPDPEFHFQPRGLAVTKDNTKLYVTSFFSFQRPGVPQVNDQGRQGIVCRLDIDTDATKHQRVQADGANRARRPQTPASRSTRPATTSPDPTSAWPEPDAEHRHPRRTRPICRTSPPRPRARCASTSTPRRSST